MTEKEILSVASDGTIGYSELMASVPAADLLITDARINHLISQNDLRGTAYSAGSLSITDKGRIHLALLIEEERSAALQKEEQAQAEAKQEAERKKQNRHDWYITVFGGALQTVVGTIAGALLTLLVQHLS